MKPADTALYVRLRVVVTAPPAGVTFAMQSGRDGLLRPAAGVGNAIRFDVALRLGPPLPDGSYNFLGDFAQGPRDDRFVYVNSGTSAGQFGSCWTRRAKLKLASIPREMVAASAGRSDRAIEARIPGTMKDGGPICATVKPQFVEWSLIEVDATG